MRAAAGMVLGDSDYAQAGMLGAQLGTVAGQQYYSREAEREADRYGISYMVRAGYDPQAAEDAWALTVSFLDSHLKQ